MSVFKVEWLFQVPWSHKVLPYQAIPMSLRFLENAGRGGLGTRPRLVPTTTLRWDRQAHMGKARYHPSRWGHSPPAPSPISLCLLPSGPLPNPPYHDVPACPRCSSKPASSRQPPGGFSQILLGAPGIRPGPPRSLS